MNLRSRILEFLPRDLIIELNSICRDVLIPDNNTKVNRMISALDKYDIDYQELGPGTNRLAILLDGYVVKIAMDKDGIRDNWAEFSMSQELQPFVIKVYECNGLLIVTEYVTVISKEEFINSKDEIRQTLSYLAQGYLLGDVGSITKNFMNWGYRDDHSLVILDFAYIYRVLGEEMICGGLNSDDTYCESILEYDADFNNLICPKCRKSYTFHEIRRKIDREYETKELETIKKIAYKVTESNQEVDVRTDKTIEAPQEETNMEVTEMGKNSNKDFIQDIDSNDAYMEALNSFMASQHKNECEEPKDTGIVSLDVPDNEEDSIGLNSYEDDEEDSVGLDSYEDDDLEELDDCASCKITYSDEEIEDDELQNEESEDESNEIETDNVECGSANQAVNVPVNNPSEIMYFEPDEVIEEKTVAPAEVDDDMIVISSETTTTKVTITSNGTDIDELRKSLLSDTYEEDEDIEDEDEYADDEYEDMYDEIDRSNLNRKISMRQKRTLE